MKLTYQQKLDALSYRFYQGASWIPKAGDFYTTSRADLELYQVVSVEDGTVRTRFTEGSEAIAEWPEAEFLTGGFGPKRVFVPEWIYPTPAAISEGDLDRLRETNRKLHRRVQIAEATAQSVQDQLGDWIEVFSSSFYRTEGRRQNERGFIIYILRDIRRRAAKLADRAALSATKGAE